MSFYKSVITVKVEIDHQFGPDQAARCVVDKLNIPAISHIQVLDVKSNYNLHGDPLPEMKSALALREEVEN
jgi:hypothetical protein